MRRVLQQPPSFADLPGDFAPLRSGPPFGRRPTRLIAALLLTATMVLASCQRSEPPAQVAPELPAPEKARHAINRATELHAIAIPELFDAIAQSSAPQDDARIAALRDAASNDLDPELQKRLHHVVARFDEAHLDDPNDDGLLAFARDWNARQAALGLPTRILHQTREHHGHHTYAPQTYLIEALHPLVVNQIPRPVEWRRRLDPGSLASPPTTFNAETGELSVLIDRALHTVQEHILPALRHDTASRHDSRRAALVNELRLHLGDDLDPLLASLHRREALSQAQRAINAAGARCTPRFRLPPLPLSGYAPQTLDRLDERAADLVAAGCDALSSTHIEALREQSAALQNSAVLRRALKRLLEEFLTQQSLMAAAHAHLYATYTHQGTTCEAPDCAALSAYQAAEVGAYLFATTEGKLPLTLMTMLCRDHRYGSAEVASHWLRLLREIELSCNAPWPENAKRRLREQAPVYLPSELQIVPRAPPELAELPQPRR